MTLTREVLLPLGTHGTCRVVLSEASTRQGSVESSGYCDHPTNPPIPGGNFPECWAAFWRPQGSGHYCPFLIPRGPHKGMR